MGLECQPIGVLEIQWELIKDHMPLPRKAEQLKLQVWPLSQKVETKSNTLDWVTHTETSVVVPKDRKTAVIMELTQLT